MLAVRCSWRRRLFLRVTQAERTKRRRTGNLIVNGDFSAVHGRHARRLATGMWVTSAGASYLEAVTLEDGTTAALVENAAANDARFEQTVAVRENATYRLTARVMAEDCGEGRKGANVSFSGIYGTSRDLHDTDGAVGNADALCANRKGTARGDGHGASGRLRLGEHAARLGLPTCALEQVETVPVGEDGA